MPMRKNFTRSISTSKEQKNMMETKKRSLFGPCEETINLIRQFARVYQYEPTLNQGLRSYIVN